jgi:hypothetical protein
LLKTTFRQRAALCNQASFFAHALPGFGIAIVRVYHSPFPAKTCAGRWWWVQVVIVLVQVAVWPYKRRSAPMHLLCRTHLAHRSTGVQGVHEAESSRMQR